MARFRRRGYAVVLISLGIGAVETQAQAPPRLGSVDFPVSCSDAAQDEFNRAVALLHHMTYPQAREAFLQVAATDPDCALAHWGVAMTLFQPLWPTRPGPDELRTGWQAVETAKSLDPPTERERLFVAAAEAFFREPASTDYWQRIRRWEQAMQEVHSAFPGDPEAIAFHALSILAVAPSDADAQANSARAAELLLSVHEQNPEHPGAMHYLIHANDSPGRERGSLDIVRKYDTVAPHNPHALHMPTHIYTRLGDWDAVIANNLLAADAALEHPAGDRREFVWDEFPHAIEYLVYAHLQKADDDEAAAQIRRLAATQRLQPGFKTAFHLASIQARYALERHAWDEAASLGAREPASLAWDRFPWPEAITWFARGLGAARADGRARLDDIRRAHRRLNELEGVASGMGETLFERQIRILRLELEGWLALVQQHADSAVALLRQAAELEATTPKHAVTPAPTIPALELLGDMLLEQDRPAEALAAYRASLERYPRRFNGVLGAARAARQGDAADAASFYRMLLEIGGDGSREAALAEASTFLSRRPTEHREPAG